MASASRHTLKRRHYARLATLQPSQPWPFHQQSAGRIVMQMPAAHPSIPVPLVNPSPGRRI